MVADELISMMNILPETHAPPRIEFAWGSLRFRCVLASASSTFQLFREDGTPVRMRVQATFNEYRDPREEAQQIKRETADYSKLRRVVQGETSVRHRQRRVPRPAASGAPIALANQIDDPTRARGRAAAADPGPAVPRHRRKGLRVSDQYAPDYRLELDDSPIPADLRGAITSRLPHLGAGGRAPGGGLDRQPVPALDRQPAARPRRPVAAVARLPTRTASSRCSSARS